MGSSQLSTLGAPARELYAQLARLPALAVPEQERLRSELREAGVHVLCVDCTQRSLDDVLTRHEAEGYLSLVEHQGFALADVGSLVLAVAPDAVIRPHFGVSPRRLAELRRTAAS